MPDPTANPVSNAAGSAPLDLLVLGEVMRVLVAEPGEALARAERFRSTIGGAEGNVAVGVSRLGHRAGWIGRVGDDDAGSYLLRRMRAEDVDVSAVRQVPGFTGLLLRNSSAHGAISVAYHRAGSAAAGVDAAQVRAAWEAARAACGPRLVHVTGISLMLSEQSAAATRELIELAAAAGVSVSFDVNLRLRLAAPEQWRTALADVAPRAQVIFAGTDELPLLPGGVDDAGRPVNPEQLAHTLIAGGATAVVCKNADHTATVYTRDAAHTEQPLARQVVDPVGAGDALVAGYLSGLLENQPPADCLRRGVGAAAFAVEGWSDTENLPDARELTGLLAADGGEQVSR
ncbi:PfkB family carbohydrate kinase [Nakamurella aerolata]|uniref:Sugar kinase n=1 Tax=Nakamurella aerolata TaxID=1656892 RepID=A0A849ABJ2_9ACTN|nr:sugar kinase [Nakamurella aerolata]